MTQNKIKAWHFAVKARTCRDLPAFEAGTIYRHTGPCILCQSGLHASPKLIDALRHAPGPIISRVECTDIVRHDSNKFVCRVRKHVWWIDASSILSEFACWCAERALHQAHVIDERCWNALKAKRLWLKGMATDGYLETARKAAWKAAQAAQAAQAARPAIEIAAGAATQAVGEATSWKAAQAAAHAAAWGAETAARVGIDRVTAYADERKAQSHELQCRVMSIYERRQ